MNSPTDTLLVLVCSEELGDGSSGPVMPVSAGETLLDFVREWLRNEPEEGQCFTVAVARITRDAFDAMPEM